MKLGLSTRLKSPNRLRAKRLGMFVAGILCFGLMVPAFIGLRVNASPSLPVGIYLVTSDQAATLVEFCLSEPYASVAFIRGYRERGSCPDGGAPLMKPVAARSGDMVEFSEAGIAVNGKVLSNSKPLTVDTNRRPLQHWPFGTYIVQPGTIWLVSLYNPRSFDSRYFGPVRSDTIRDRLRPLLTMR